MMRATSDNAVLPAPPEARDVPRATATDDAASVFAATLGLATTSLAKVGADATKLGTDDKKTETVSDVAVTNAFLGMQLAPALPLPTVLAKGGAEVTEKGFTIEAARPRPSGIDLSSFEIIPQDQQVALPLEAALQQLTAGTDKGVLPQLPAPAATVAPENAPVRVVTPANEIVEVVSRHVARGEQHVTMVLRPAELGEVKVRIEHGRDNHVSIKLEAETKDTTAVLRARIPELQATLAQQGVTVGSVDVTLTASDAMQQRTGGDSAQQQHGQSDREEYVEVEDATRTQKRTKRNNRDLDVVV